MTRIELVDAQLARVACEADRVTLHLSSAPAWRPGEGADTRPVPGHQTGVTLAFDGASCTFDAGSRPSDCIGAVREARLHHNGQAQHTLALPTDWHGALVLQLALGNGTGLEVRAQRLRVQPPGSSRFIESFAC